MKIAFYNRPHYWYIQIANLLIWLTIMCFLFADSIIFFHVLFEDWPLFTAREWGIHMMLWFMALAGLFRSFLYSDTLADTRMVRSMKKRK
jgi:hypothetical protein